MMRVMQLTTFPIILEESFMISSKVKHFIFNCDLSPSFDYLAGQFITVHFDHEGASLKRSYSIANEPLQNNRIEFAAGYVEKGPGTELLFNLKPGATINISGPFGRLIFKDEVPERYILVATSTGITPFRAMLSELSKRLQIYPNLKAVILQGVQKSEDVLYHQDFLNFAQANPQVTFKSCLSRVESEALKEHEYAGYVQSLFPDLDLNPAKDVIYLCGNPGMIDDAFDYLKENGFATQQVIREKYLSR